MSTPQRPPGSTGDDDRIGMRYRFDARTPNEARRYDYWLGGKDNFEADRRSGDQIAAAVPMIRTAAIENRRFLRRAVGYLAEQAGVRQFLDIGAGIPTEPTVHQIAQFANPSARVVYVDKDPVVMVHARALLTGTRSGRLACVEHDLRHPQRILADPDLMSTLDFDEPVGLLLVAVLHFIADPDDPYGCVDALVTALPPGSYVVVSHASLDLLPSGVAAEVRDLAAPGAGHGTFQPRSREQIARFLTGLELIEPGLVPVTRWRSLDPDGPELAADTGMYAAVGAKR